VIGARIRVPLAEAQLLIVNTSDVGLGSWTAVRQTVAMLQHCLNKQTLCRRDCEPL